MRLSLKTIIVIFLAFWLPVQATAGMVMALSSAQESATMTTPALDSHVQAMSADCPMHRHADGDVVAGKKLGVTCNHCGVCQLAASGFLLASEPAMPQFESAQVLFMPYKDMFLSHIPAPPQQPPKHFT